MGSSTSVNVHRPEHDWLSKDSAQLSSSSSSSSSSSTSLSPSPYARKTVLPLDDAEVVDVLRASEPVFNKWLEDDVYATLNAFMVDVKTGSEHPVLFFPDHNWNVVEYGVASRGTPTSRCTLFIDSTVYPHVEERLRSIMKLLVGSHKQPLMPPHSLSMDHMRISACEWWLIVSPIKSDHRVRLEICRFSGAPAQITTRLLNTEDGAVCVLCQTRSYDVLI